MDKQKLKTYHLMLLDSSSSMNTVKKSTISGLNEQLQSIKKAEKDFDDQEQIVCFITFGSEVEHSSLWNKKIDSIEDFNDENYTPNGLTALLDATGIGINKLRNEIKSDLQQRKANVVVTIFTDGEENNSKEYNSTEVSNLIKEVKETGQWTVTFVGCSDNAFEVAQSLGIGRGDTLHYASGDDGTQSAFKTMAKSRYCRSAAYSNCVSKGLDTSSANLGNNFFNNIDLDGTTKKDEYKKDTDKKEKDKS